MCPRLQIFGHFLKAYAEVKAPPHHPQDLLAAAAKQLIRPMLEKSFDRGEALLDPEILDGMVKHIFDAPDEVASGHLPLSAPHHAARQ